MKLQQKLVLLTTLSKGLMAAILLLALPWVVQTLVMRHTDSALQEELQQVQARIAEVGIGDFLPQAPATRRTHYDLLQEEFIDLQATKGAAARDTIGTFPRRQHGVAVDFRVLRHSGYYQGRLYTFEIGKSIASVEDVYDLLRTSAGYALAFTVLTTLLIELGVIGHLLRPVDHIVERLRAVRGPQAPDFPPLRTTTSDFQYLDASIQQMLLKIQRVFEQERQFIANASHELLTPISILQNRFENMLRAENLPEEAEAQLVTSQKTLQRMTATLRTLLLISRVENNQFPRNETVDMREVLTDAVEELEDRIGDKQIDLRWTLTGQPMLAPASRTLMFTLIINLLSNAIKYNRVGGEIELSGQPEASEAYVLNIRNTGKPIAADNLPHLFERFRRFDPESAEGEGLGLAVVRSIAQLHFVQISVSSEEGRGTTFSLRLPPVLPATV